MYVVFVAVTMDKCRNKTAVNVTPVHESLSLAEILSASKATSSGAR